MALVSRGGWARSRKGGTLMAMHEVISGLLGHDRVKAARQHIERTDDVTLARQATLSAIPAPTGAEAQRAARVAELFREAGLGDVRVGEAGDVSGWGPGGGKSPLKGGRGKGGGGRGPPHPGPRRVHRAGRRGAGADRAPGAGLAALPRHVPRPGGPLLGCVRRRQPGERGRARHRLARRSPHAPRTTHLVRRRPPRRRRSEEHTSELQSLAYLVCRLLLEKKKKKRTRRHTN